MNCKQCGCELKNGRCSSCGFDPSAPQQGKSEAQLRDDAEAKRIRSILGQGGATTATAAVPGAAPEPAAAPAATPGDNFHQ